MLILPLVYERHKKHREVQLAAKKLAEALEAEGGESSVDSNAKDDSSEHSGVASSRRAKSNASTDSSIKAAVRRPSA